MEDEEREDHDMSDIPSPPTPSKPRTRTDGSTPPNRNSFMCMVSDQENDADVSDDEEMSEKETKPYPNPPTPIKAR